MKVSIDTITRTVVAEYGVSTLDVVSPRRDALAVEARHVAMYLARALTGQSFPMIGRRFGDRDHSTVMHAARRVAARMEADPGFAARIGSLVISMTRGG